MHRESIRALGRDMGYILAPSARWGAKNPKHCFCDHEAAQYPRGQVWGHTHGNRHWGLSLSRSCRGLVWRRERECRVSQRSRHQRSAKTADGDAGVSLRPTTTEQVHVVHRQDQSACSPPGPRRGVARVWDSEWAGRRGVLAVVNVNWSWVL